MSCIPTHLLPALSCLAVLQVVMIAIDLLGPDVPGIACAR